MRPGGAEGRDAPALFAPTSAKHSDPMGSRWTKAAVFLTLTIVLLALIGVVRVYSPVPFWDMWDGYIDFFMRAREGGLAPWLAPHGEHRLVLSRPFFYADLAWLGGRGMLPIAAGLMLAGGIAAVFIQAARRTAHVLTPSACTAVYAVLVGGSFFWSQRENFTWAFQVQFFLVAWLPLCAFYLAARAATEPTRGYLAPTATVCAALALGAMANGIFALPILLVLGACIGLSARWLAGTALTAMLAIVIFQQGFQGGQTHVPMLSVLVERPIDVMHFTLRYLGSPLWFACGWASWSTSISEVAAAAILTGSAAFVPAAWRTRREDPMRLAMLAVIAYVTASAFATALGRLPFSYGLAGASVSRYTTLGVMAWLAFFVSALRILPPRSVRFIPLIATVLLLGLIPWQLRTLRNQADIRYSRDLAALALATQMNDPAAVGTIYPAEQMPHVLEIAKRARDAHVPAFGQNALWATTGWLGRRLPAPSCQSGIEGSRTLSAGGHQGRIDGHLKAPFSQSADGAALVVDEHDIIVGWALVRSRAARERGDAVHGPAFSGFVADPRVADAGWTTTSLRICPLPKGASFAYSE